MLVDMRTPRGKELFDGVFDGRTIYRDDFYRNTLIADILLRNGKTAEQGLNFAIKAFKSKPCRTSSLQLSAQSDSVHCGIRLMNLQRILCGI